MTPEQAAALATIAAAVHETHAQQQRISASAAILAASLGDAPPPPPTPTYSVTASAPTVDEGGSITYTVTTTHVPAGTVIGQTTVARTIVDEIPTSVTSVARHDHCTVSPERPASVAPSRAPWSSPS